MAEYVELHCHSAFSFREGASTPLELALTAKYLGYTALALTDHDSLAGAMEFAQAAPDWGIKPIIGAEITLRSDTDHPPAHLTLIASTQRGYANLSRLLSEALLSSPRDDPSLDPAALEGRTDGLIALSGCSRGEVPRRIMQYDTDGACTIAKRYAEMFGRDSFYIELQNNLVYRDTRRNRGLAALARQLNLSIVATNNVHYHDRARHRLQDVLVAVRHKTTLDTSERLRRKNSEFYLKSPKQMASLFPELPEALSNTLVIAEHCTFDMKKDLTYVFPDFEAPDGKDVDDYLEEVCRAAALELYVESPFATTPRRRGNNSSPML